MRLASATATLINGIFGDPLLHVHLTNRRRHLLFDVGEAARLPTRVIHQTSDIFFSHAHADHIGGFLWFLRSRIGYYPCCRVFGPPSIAANIAGLVKGLLWDRVADRAPQFEVAELHPQGLKRWRIVAGAPEPQRLCDQPVAGRTLLVDPAFTLQAIALEHGMGVGRGMGDSEREKGSAAERGSTPVLAYRLSLAPRFNVCKQKLAAFQLPAGPWLQHLKRALESGDMAATLSLPDGSAARVSELAEQLLQRERSDTLVYATDLADIPANRSALASLAEDADVLFCEAPYRLKDQALATANGHLTTRACGELAIEARVKKLVPFHFSKRYGGEAEDVYREVQAGCAEAARRLRMMQGVAPATVKRNLQPEIRR